jgi:predicted transposase/invertase (TIGR01784 family)
MTNDNVDHYKLSREMGELDERSRLYSAEKRAIENRNREIAKNLLSINLAIEDIARTTGLTQEEILSLQV